MSRLNRALERLRRLRLDGRLLGERARARDARPPVVLVPGMFGTRLVDERGRVLWGATRRLYRGPSLVTTPGARSAGLLDGFTLVPGLWSRDVYGGLARFLSSVGGYHAGEDLAILDYDWRAGVRAGAEALASLVERLRGAGDERVDLIAISTGGLIARAFLAGGGSPWVRRVVHVGTPQRGSFDALACLHRGFRFAPGGKVFAGADAARCQTSWDALPHPADPLFVDDEGAPIAPGRYDLYDAAAWRALGLAPPGLDEATARDSLRRARALHESLDAATTHGDAIVIGAAHLPTPCRIVVARGRAHVPPPTPRRDDPWVGFGYAPGDGELTVASLRALPGLDTRRLWLARPSGHAQLPSDPSVHRLVLEALLATDRFIPPTKLERTPAC